MRHAGESHPKYSRDAIYIFEIAIHSQTIGLGWTIPFYIEILLTIGTSKDRKNRLIIFSAQWWVIRNMPHCMAKRSNPPRRSTAYVINNLCSLVPPVRIYGAYQGATAARRTIL